MMNFPAKRSRNVCDGDAVSIRGDKLIRCGRRAKFLGVFMYREARHTLTAQGCVPSVHPEGVVVHGSAAMNRR